MTKIYLARLDTNESDDQDLNRRLYFDIVVKATDADSATIMVRNRILAAIQDKEDWISGSDGTVYLDTLLEIDPQTIGDAACVVNYRSQVRETMPDGRVFEGSISCDMPEKGEHPGLCSFCWGDEPDEEDEEVPAGGTVTPPLISPDSKDPVLLVVRNKGQRHRPMGEVDPPPVLKVHEGEGQGIEDKPDVLKALDEQMHDLHNTMIGKARVTEEREFTLALAVLTLPDGAKRIPMITMEYGDEEGTRNIQEFVEDSRSLLLADERLEPRLTTLAANDILSASIPQPE